MLENEIIAFIGIIVFAFSVLFFYTGTLEKCFYRRFIIPAMLLCIAIIVREQMLASLLIIFSVPLIYFGFKGYGIEIKKETTKEETD